MFQGSVQDETCRYCSRLNTIRPLFLVVKWTKNSFFGWGTCGSCCPLFDWWGPGCHSQWPRFNDTETSHSNVYTGDLYIWNISNHCNNVLLLWPLSLLCHIPSLNCIHSSVTQSTIPLSLNVEECVCFGCLISRLFVFLALFPCCKLHCVTLAK